MLEIDGSQGEGGGQVLRTSLSLSCVLQKPMRIRNIRTGRGNPGLQAQHLTVCRLLTEISGAKTEGARLGSTTVEFEPGRISGGNYKLDIGTAGSCTLLMQAALPVLCFADSKSSLEITGGTHVLGAPTFEYFSEVFLPAARKFGVKADARMESLGFYPKGGGKAALDVEPSLLCGAKIEAAGEGEVGYSIISSALPSHVASREEEIVKQNFPRANGCVKASGAAYPGNAVTIWSGMRGASSLGERGKPAEAVALEACSALRKEIDSGAAADAHLADQLLIYAALSKGRTEYSASGLSRHLETNAAIIRAVAGRNIMLQGDGNRIGVY